MSRIGRLPVKIPKGITVKVDGSQVSIQGPKGKVTQECAPEVTVAVQGDSLVVARVGRQQEGEEPARAVPQPAQELAARAVGGFSKVLTISGVGYKAEVKGKSLVLNLGYSTPIEYPIPEGITMDVEATQGHREGRRQAAGRPDRLRDPLLPRRPSPTRARGSSTRASTSAARWGSRASSRKGVGMKKIVEKTRKRLKRKASIRKKLHGTPERPRMTVYKSNRHTYVQAIDDVAGATVASASNLEKDARGGTNKTAGHGSAGRAHRGAPEGEEGVTPSCSTGTATGTTAR